jgi:hypothetical protein
MSNMSGHPAGGYLIQMVRDQKEQDKKAATKKADAALDAANPALAVAVFDAAEQYAASDIALKAGAALHQWAETSADDLDEGETMATRLSSLFVGIVDADLDGEVGEDEADALEVVLESAWDYLAGKGVGEDDISAVLNDWDDAAAARVQELLASSLPDGEDAAADDLDSFAFKAGDGSDESAMDSLQTMDAVYKMKVAIRGGKKVRIKKRIAGHVRLSAKQKLAVRKMLRKTHSAGAQMKRMKSMRVRRRMMGS